MTQKIASQLKLASNIYPRINQWILWALSFLILAKVLALWVTAYSVKEVIFQNWDARMYFEHASRYVEAANSSLANGYAYVAKTFASTHNALYAIPVSIFMTSAVDWQGYRFGLVFTLFLPAVLCFALVIAELAETKKRSAFLIGVALSIVLPVFWSSVILYYPDVGAMGVQIHGRRILLT